MRRVPATWWPKIHVVPLGVADVSPPRAREHHPPPWHIVCAGRLAPVKGHQVLIDAIATLRAAGRDVVLHLAGDGPSRRDLELAARKAGLASAVVFEGLLNERALDDLYARADIFALPTFAEGVPVVLMEAMIRELPCVSTWVNGVPELIDAETNGLLVPPGDADALAAALDRLLTDAPLRRRLGQNGRRKVLAAYDVVRNVQALARVFEQRLGDPVAAAADAVVVDTAPSSS
jgi:glycosyltransferase involved in cell wall biosynthesis